ncbi:zinc finger protein 766-like [Helicoverpa zea]|uniref:zinc finger protein 766-like n=1 Tax=Helicoverpa zea TaxID=7113 RepID=UPI001F588F35|nr:zinc finger protein 766-like [Helicoverpa zea]
MMRTYTRKRPNHQLIEDVHELCRLCLNKTMEAMPIFSEDSDNICATLALRIMICVGLEMKRDAYLPNIICTDCYDQLNKYYAFRKKCEVTYQKLKSHVLAVKEKEYKHKIKEEADNKMKLEQVENEEELKYVVTFDKEQYPDVNGLNLNGVAQMNHFTEKLPELSKIELLETKDNDQTEEEVPSDPDITTFLSTMLVELGILTPGDNGLIYSNQNIKSLELETGDGSSIVMELVEEDDAQEQIVSAENQIEASSLTQMTQEQVTDQVQANDTKKVEDTFKENECIIKYVTSNAQIKKDKPDKKCAWCSECGRRLASRSALTRHLRTHSGERPYACHVCGRTFAQKEVMVRHLLVHGEQRPFACSVCDKSFTQRGALAAHARQHAPPAARPLALHRCDRCPKVFLYASGLSRHMMMHNGRVYVCGACERQFKDKSSLLRHLKNANHAPRASAPT